MCCGCVLGRTYGDDAGPNYWWLMSRGHIIGLGKGFYCNNGDLETTVGVIIVIYGLKGDWRLKGWRLGLGVKGVICC